MLRPNVSRTLLSLAVITTLAFSSAASAQMSWKLYDLRDLIDVVPPHPRAETIVQTAAPITMVDVKLLAPRLDPADPVDELMDKLCDALGIIRTPLFPGVYGIEAEEVDHTTLLRMLEQVRELYNERYEVELLWYAIPPDQSPSIGDPVTPMEPLHRHRLVVLRRTPTEFVQVSRYTYVSGIQPVVAQGAVGYASETGREESGLRVSIVVGAGGETETTTDLRVMGDLRRTAMGKVSGPLTADQKCPMQIELPEVTVRSIRSSIRIQYGKLTALGVVDGFEAGECVVVAASVRKLGD